MKAFWTLGIAQSTSKLQWSMAEAPARCGVLGPGVARAGLLEDLYITEPQSQSTLPGGNTGLRLPAPRQAHSPSGHAGTYGDCSNSAGISPPLTGARPGRRCPHFMLKWRYAEVLNNVDLTPTIERNSEKLAMAP